MKEEKGFSLTLPLYDREIRVQVRELKEGCTVLLTGGDLSHIGAVTVKEPKHRISTIEREGHCDSVISRKWAERISSEIQEPVCVCCGIHYDRIDKEQIEAVVAFTDRMLEKVVRILK